jgi:tRNA threonylcarbamoyladenosine biosynthesis protein TsaB
MASVPDRYALLRRTVWRPLREADLAYVAALEAQIHAAPWSYGNFRDALAAGYGAQVGEW